MKRRLALLFSLCGLSVATSAAIPGALQLLPADTVGFVTTTDWNKAKAAWEANNLGRLWNDPAMRPFRERFERRFREEVIEHAEKQLGVKLSDYLALAQGQVTFAILRGDWKPDADATPPWVLLVDAGAKGSELKPLLEDAAKKLRAANKTVTTQKVRDVEFTTVVLDPSDFDKLQKNPARRGPKPAGAQDEDEDDDPGAKPRDRKPSKIELSFTQLGGALVVTTSPKSTERILARLGGGSIDSIGSQDRLQAARQSVLKDGLVQAWIDVTPFLTDISQGLGGLLAMVGADPRKAASATGLDAVQWAAVNLQESSEGTTVHSAIGVPEARRTGVFKLIQPEVKDSSPPAFVPPDAVKFQRWRLNGQKFWKTLEDSLNQISPQLLGILKLGLDSAGQQDDPNFTFKGELIDRLGDDLITFEKAPKGRTLPELNSPPSLVLLSSPKPERLVNGFRALMLMSQMQGGAGGIEVRDFLGRKIYSARMAAPGGRSTRTHLAAGTDYVAISSSVSMVEEFLRHTEGSGKTLKDFPGLAAAAEWIGGMSTGFFTFENQLESSRATWELLRQGGSLDRVMPPGTANLDTAKAIEEWADFSLLPDFEKVSRLFTFGVMVGSSDNQAFHFKWFAPAARR